MTLHKFPHRLLAPLALALAAFAVPPTPALRVDDGLRHSAHGRYAQISRRVTALQGLMRNAEGQATFDVDALLSGPDESGNLSGRLKPRAFGGGPESLWEFEYTLLGSYARGSDGVVRFFARIDLVVPSEGGSIVVSAGELQGRLLAAAGAERGVEPTGRAVGSLRTADEPERAHGAFVARVTMFE